MRVKIHNKLALLIAERLSPFVSRDSYVNLKANGSKFSATIQRDDAIVEVILDASLVGDKDLMEVTSDGEYAVNGHAFVNLISTAKIDGPVTMEFQPLDDSKSAENQENQEDEDIPQPLGSLKMSFPWLTKKKEDYRLQCVTRQKFAKIEGDKGKSIIVSPDILEAIVQKLIIAAGKDTGNPEWSQIRLKASQKKIELVAYNGFQLGWAIIDADNVVGDLCHFIPYGTFKSMVGTIKSEPRLVIQSPLSGPKGVFAGQEIQFAEKAVGATRYRLFTINDKFPEFEKVVKNLNFRSECKVDVQKLRYVMERLAIIEPVRTSLSFSPSDKLITFKKASAVIESGSQELPLVETSGVPLKLDISDRMIRMAAQQCDEEETTIKFSGTQGLILMSVSPDFKMFFPPFTKS